MDIECFACQAARGAEDGGGGDAGPSEPVTIPLQLPEEHSPLGTLLEKPSVEKPGTLLAAVREGGGAQYVEDFLQALRVHVTKASKSRTSGHPRRTKEQHTAWKVQHKLLEKNKSHWLWTSSVPEPAKVVPAAASEPLSPRKRGRKPSEKPSAAAVAVAEGHEDRHQQTERASPLRSAKKSVSRRGQVTPAEDLAAAPTAVSAASKTTKYKDGARKRGRKDAEDDAPAPAAADVAVAAAESKVEQEDFLLAPTAKRQAQVPSGNGVMLGRNASGRVWKGRQQSIRAVAQRTAGTKVLASSFQERQRRKAELQAVKDRERELHEAKQLRIEEEKAAKLEKERRRQANELKNTTYQTITKAHKLKTMSKKQLRQVKKTQLNQRTGEIELVSPWGKGKK